MSWWLAGLIAGVAAYFADYFMWGKVFTKGMDLFVTPPPAGQPLNMGPMLGKSAVLSLIFGVLLAWLYRRFMLALWVQGGGPLAGMEFATVLWLPTIALSTLGSILGTFVPAFILIPKVGTAATLYTASAALLVFSILGLTSAGLTRRALIFGGLLGAIGGKMVWEGLTRRPHANTLPNTGDAFSNAGSCAGTWPALLSFKNSGVRVSPFMVSMSIQR